MIVLVAGEGQAEALDRPGDEQGRDIVLRGVESLDQRFHAMAAEIGEQRGERIVVMGLRGTPRPLPSRPRSACARRRRPDNAAPTARHWAAARTSPSAPCCRRARLQPLAVAQLDHAPAAASEDLVEALEHPVGAGRVEALAVIVDDPPQVADVVLRALDDRFVDIAFVELGIADQRDKAAAVLPRPAGRGR